MPHHVPQSSCLTNHPTSVNPTLHLILQARKLEVTFSSSSQFPLLHPVFHLSESHLSHWTICFPTPFIQPYLVFTCFWLACWTNLSNVPRPPFLSFLHPVYFFDSLWPVTLGVDSSTELPGAPQADYHSLHPNTWPKIPGEPSCSSQWPEATVIPSFLPFCLQKCPLPHLSLIKSYPILKIKQNVFIPNELISVIVPTHFIISPLLIFVLIFVVFF